MAMAFAPVHGAQLLTLRVSRRADMFHGGTMWGNWSTTVRRTRLTPSYANTANLASDSIVYNPKYQTIADLHLIIAK